jgi:CRP/FNR family transcriptional regulator, cyclic AMP receptor protein
MTSIGIVSRRAATDPIKISHELLAKAGASTVRLAPGDVVFKGGDAPDKMYVVISGEVEIRLGDAIIETVSQGGTFGEMALIDGSAGSATVTAKTEAEVAAIDKKTFVLLVDEMPYFALFVMGNMVNRLRRMNEQWLSLRPRAFQGS